MPHNRVVVRYGLVHAGVELPRSFDFRASPRVTVRLDSVLVAWGLKAVLQQPFVRIQGRDVTIDLARIPALAPWRDWLTCLSAVDLATVDGALDLGFSFTVSE